MASGFLVRTFVLPLRTHEAGCASFAMVLYSCLLLYQIKRLVCKRQASGRGDTAEEELTQPTTDHLSSDQRHQSRRRLPKRTRPSSIFRCLNRVSRISWLWLYGLLRPDRSSLYLLRYRHVVKAATNCGQPSPNQESSDGGNRSLGRYFSNPNQSGRPGRKASACRDSDNCLVNSSQLFTFNSTY